MNTHTHTHTHTHTRVWGHGRCKGKLAVEPADPVPGQGSSGARTAAHNSRGRVRHQTSPPHPPSGRHIREAGPAHCAGRTRGPPQLSPLPAHSPPHMAAQFRLAENSPSAPGPPFLRRAPCLLPAGARRCEAGLASSLLCSSGPCPHPWVTPGLSFSTCRIKVTGKEPQTLKRCFSHEGQEIKGTLGNKQAEKD